MKLLSAVLLSVISAAVHAAEKLQIDTQLNVDGELRPIETFYIDNGGTVFFKPEGSQEYDAKLVYRCERHWYRLWIEKCEDVIRPRAQGGLGLVGTIRALKTNTGNFLVVVDGNYFLLEDTKIFNNGRIAMEFSNLPFSRVFGSSSLSEGKPASFISSDGKVELIVTIKGR